MDRRTVTQLVAMVVVLCILMRWLPAEEGKGTLGLGDPWRTLALDRQVTLMGGDSDAALAFLRFRPPTEPPQTAAQRQRVQQAADWRAKLKLARELRRDAGPDTVVEFQGVPRNEIWPLMFRLYPVPCTPWTLEDGSRYGDGLLPGATPFPKGVDEPMFRKLVEQMYEGTPPPEAVPEWAREGYAAQARPVLQQRAAAFVPARTALATGRWEPGRDDSP